MLIEMVIKGLMVDPLTNLPIIILRDETNERVLPIWVGPVEANAIALQVENVSTPRPMTHDLLRHVMAELGGRLTRVIIHDLKESTFYAYLEVERDGERLLIDARPSDALALSLRTKVPIFVNVSVFEHARGADVAPQQVDQERLQRWLESLDPDDLGYTM
ncbi:MAG: bifunctional nuclease family protein [Acidimicrobiia bacterium]|nr:bifunctional nuclease family protein [Acidimicrobiia bacterium]